MEETLNKILSELQHLGTGQKELLSRTSNLEKGQKELIGRSDNLEKGQEELIISHKQLSIRMENVENGQKDIISRTNNLEKGQKELIGRTDNLEKGQELLISGQQEIKDIIRHTATLMTENFTTIRRDMKTLAFDVNSDVELLFKEMADVKRKVNKLEQK